MNIKMMIPFIVILLSACGGGGGGGGSSSSSSGGGNTSSSSSSSSSSGNSTTVKSWGTPVQLSAAEVAALDVSLALDPDGNAIAVWQQHVFANDAGQAAASYLISGQNWSAPATIHGFDSFFIELPQVKVDASGNAIAVWFQGVTDPPEQGLVRANRYVRGSGWGTAETLQEYPDSATVTPKLVMMPSSKALAVWSEQNGDTVWACFFSAGAWCDDPDPVTVSVGTISAFSVEVAADAAGNAIAVWLQRDGSMDDLPDAMANRYNGAAWSTPVRLEGSMSIEAYNPKIGLDAAGNGIAVWQAFETGEIKIYSTRYSTSTGWNEPQLLGTGAWLELAVAANGGAIAIWRFNDMDLHAAVFSPVSGWSNPQIIDANSNDVEYQQVAINDFGDAIVVWSQSDGIQDSIWANHYEAGGGWSGARLVESQNTHGAHRPVIVIDNNNNAIAAWDYYSNPGNQVWANRYE